MDKARTPASEETPHSPPCPPGDASDPSRRPPEALSGPERGRPGTRRAVEILTLDDVAFLYDGLQDDLPEGMAERLRRWVHQDPQFADPISTLEAIATGAGMPRTFEQRLTEAVGLVHDLERLIEAGDDWQDPSEVLDPDGDRGVDLYGLTNLARSVERRRSPPTNIGEVHGKLVQALQKVAAEADLVETFVAGLLERPTRAAGLLRAARRQFLEQSESRTRSTPGRPILGCQTENRPK